MPIVANLRAIAGGLFFGHLSEKTGRVNTITIAQLIAPPVILLWAKGSTAVPFAIGAFIMQLALQGASGLIRAHLNELVPGAARATLPEFVYPVGNFLASCNGPFQARVAETPRNSYS